MGLKKLYFSDREKKILKLLLEYANGITQEELQQILNVSRRTIYREISSIEKSLMNYHLQIVKPRGEGYQLIGESEDLEKLSVYLKEEEQDQFIDNVQRQSAIAVNLLLADEPEFMDSLALTFGVSVGTIHNDLAIIEKSLTEYGLKLRRIKGKGIEVIGSEKARRQILSGLMYNGISEYEFFHYAASLDETHLNQKTQNFFLQQISNEAFYLAKEAVLNYSKKAFTDVTDNQLQQVILILAISIDRMTTNHPVEEVIDQGTIPEVKMVIDRILNYLEDNTGLDIDQNERNFFARRLEGVNYKTPQNIFLENFDVALSYQVKEVIRKVAQALEIDFPRDETLFYDLLAHMSAALKRKYSLFQMGQNPLLERIIKEYRELANGVMTALKEVFPDHEFSLDELGYIVIHFATSLERNPDTHNMSVLVLCSSGIGTSKILESRLRKHVANVNQIQVAKISEMNHLDYQNYDLILSTVFLPGFSLPYKLISPLLLEDELEEIKTFIKEKEKSTEELPPKVLPHAAEAFDDIYETMRAANNLLKQFTVKQVKSQKSLVETLAVIIHELAGITEDPDYVVKKVYERYLVAPIGVPNSNFALFHSSNKKVLQPYFGIYDLDEPFVISGMDKKDIRLTRILLMLAPDPIPEHQQLILGKISSSVIESDLNTEIYKYGNHEIIYQLLSSLFVKEIRDIE